MEHRILLAIIIGYSAGVLAGYLLSRWIIVWLARNCRRPRLVALLGAVGGLAALLPSFLLSTFVEGNLTAGYGEMVTPALGLGTLGLPVALAVELVLILAVIPSAGALLGATMARWIASHQPPRAAL